MPLIKTIADGLLNAGFWRIDESVDELFDQAVLSEYDLQEYRQFSSIRRQKEFLAVRLIMEALTGGKAQIVYDSHGRPGLPGSGKFISVSHSPSLAAVLIAGAPCGMDVEEQYRRVERVASRFLSEYEFKWTGSADDPGMVRVICWCAKEAVYKMVRDSGVDFASQISIFAFDPSTDTLIKAEYLGEAGCKSISLRFGMVENNVAAWCVENMDS